MTLKQFEKEGYKLKAWTISTIENDRRIAVILSRQVKDNIYKYVTSCLCSDKPLRENEFTMPILMK